MSRLATTQGPDREAADDDSLEAFNVQRMQIAQTVRALPLLVVFHAAAALSVYNISLVSIPMFPALVWQLCAVAVGLSMSGFFVCWRFEFLRARPDRAMRLLEVICLVLGLTWGAPSAALATVEQSASVIPVAGICLAMLGVGVASLIRVPTGATVFVAIVTAALARALFSSGQDFGPISALVCAIYGLTLVGIALNSHLDFLRRAKAELDVQRQNEVVRLLLNDYERDARDWLWETDSEGRLTYVSHRFADVLRVAPDSLRLRPLRHIIADHSPSDSWRELEQAMAQEAPIAGLQFDLEISGHAASWNLTARPKYARNGRYNGYRGVCRDVTATREAQRKLEMAVDVSEKANAAKSQFLAIMSHELRTPINAIVGFAEMLAREKHGALSAGSQREFASTILDSSRELQTLINDILDATRMERGSFRLVEQEGDAAEIIEVAIKLCREQAEKAGVSLVGRLVDGVSLSCDVPRIKQVITNLLTNAVKFSPQGGVVNVEMQKGQGGQFVLAIKDAGIGIAAGDLARVFEPFVQADGSHGRQYGGVGLGLAIARRIARLHDGDVTLESEPGNGTTALLVLPKTRTLWSAQHKVASQQVA